MDSEVPITLVYWLAALVPLATLLVLLIGLRWTAAQAGATGFFVAVVLALLVFQADTQNVAVATGKGIWDALFILAVVWPALLLYELSDKAGAFEVFRQGLQKFTTSKLLLVLLFGWVFASFLQGIAGFGTPIAIVAPLLVGIGVRPLMAVVIPLIGHAYANMFGTLAVGWLATTRVVDLENTVLTAVVTAVLLWIPNLVSGFWIAWLYGRTQAIARAWPVVLAVSLVQAGGQVALAAVNPIVSTFIPATVALGVVLLMERMKRFQQEPLGSDIFTEESKAERAEEPAYSMHLAMAPYYALIGISLVVLVIPPVNDFLRQVEIGFGFPEVSTGFGFTQAAERPYSPVTVLTHPGVLLLFASAVAYAIFKSKGLYKTGAERTVLAGMAKNSLPASISVMGFLTLSKLMDHSGMTEVLALGIAAVSPPLVYAFLANFIGILGAFMTSSNTASNILFAPLQQQTATAQGLSEAAIIGAQSTGGAIGNAVAPANVVLGTGPAKIPGQEGAVLKKTLPYALVTGALTGLATIAFVLLL